MAITKLPTNYTDDILDISQNAHRKYKITEVDTDIYTFEDETVYIQQGTVINAEKVNATNSTVNELIDAESSNETSISNIEDGTTPIAKAKTSTSSATAGKLASACKINGVAFDGTKSITITDSTKVQKDDDFILSRQTLSFSNNVATINDSRITSSSVATVYYTSETISVANSADITVETYNGYVQLTATNTPSGTIVASIHIKVV